MKRRRSTNIGALFPAPAIALGFVLLHFYTRDDGWLRFLRSERAWLAILGILLLLSAPATVVFFAQKYGRQSRGRARSDPERQERAYDVMLYQTIGNALLIPLVIAAVVVVGSPWWAVLVTTLPVIGGSVSLANMRRALRPGS